MSGQVDVFDVVFLGTMSGAPPSGGRNQSCTAVRMDSNVWLFDCGDGAQGQVQRSSISASSINRVFITHLHGDHCFGLPGLVCNVAVSTASKANREPLVLVGPTGLRDLVRVTLGTTYCRLGDFKYKVIELAGIPHHPELKGYSAFPDTNHMNELPGEVVYPNALNEWIIPVQATDKGVSVKAVALSHTVPTVGYVITEGLRVGKLDIARARPIIQQFGLPQSVFGKLKNGESIQLPDGSVLRPEDFVGPAPRSRKIVILGDTYEGDSDVVSRAGMHCDLLVHEATNACLQSDLASGLSYESVEKQTIDHGHSTPQMAGRAAAKMQAVHLAMTHFSPRYRGDGGAEGEAVREEIVKLAQTVFSGSVTAARDFDSISIVVGGGVIPSTRQALASSTLTQ